MLSSMDRYKNADPLGDLLYGLLIRGSLSNTATKSRAGCDIAPILEIDNHGIIIDFLHTQ
jgi:hypothetical protein